MSSLFTFPEMFEDEDDAPKGSAPMTTLFILGASDPEMEAIEGLLRNAGQKYAYATMGGKRVYPSTAYRSNSLAESQRDEIEVPPIVDAVYLVECDANLVVKGPRTGMCDGYCSGQDHSHPWTGTVVRADHHRPGDPGFGRPPAEFLSASSIGQVMGVLLSGGYLPQDWSAEKDMAVRMCAAADHCLGAAYRGECPGVDPVALAIWRAESRAKFQGVPVAQITSAVEAAKEALLYAPKICIIPLREPGWIEDEADAIAADEERSYTVRDMRGPVVPELPEAACQLGVGYIAGPLASPDGRQKITCSGSESQVHAFLEVWAPSQNLVDIYGDPARGFAGGYLP